LLEGRLVSYDLGENNRLLSHKLATGMANQLEGHRTDKDRFRVYLVLFEKVQMLDLSRKKVISSRNIPFPSFINQCFFHSECFFAATACTLFRIDTTTHHPKVHQEFE
jgi:hypothetical protein